MTGLLSAALFGYISGLFVAIIFEISTDEAAFASIVLILFLWTGNFIYRSLHR